MKIWIITITTCLCFVVSQSIAQDQSLIDSLTEELNNDIPEKDEIKIYLSIAAEYTYADSAKVVEYAMKAMDIAESIGDEEGKIDAELTLAWALFLKGYYQEAEEKYATIIKDAQKIQFLRGEADSYGGLGNAYMWRSQYDTAKYFFLKAVAIQKEIDDKKGLGYAYHNLGNLSFFQGSYNEALRYFNNSLEVKDASGDEIGKLGTYLGIGNAFFRQGIYSQALESYLKALNGFEKTGDKRGITLVNSNAGNIYLLQKDYPKALEYYQRALEVREEAGDKKGMADSYNNLGATHKSLKNYERALFYFDKSLTLKVELEDKRGIGVTYNNIGDIYLSEGDENRALEYYTRALALRKEIGDRRGEASSLLNMGKAFLVLNQYPKAANYINDGLSLSEEMGLLENISKAYNLLANLEDKRGNHEKAFQAHVKYKEMADSLINQENTKKITRLEAEYEFQQERDSVAIEQQAASFAYEKELAKEQWTKYIVVLIAISISIIAYLLFRSYRRKKADNELLTEKNQKLKELRESEKKLSEEAIASKERELATMAMSSHEKNAVLKDLEQKVSFIEKRLGDEMQPSLKEMKKTISESYSLDKSWDSFIHRFEDVHPQFFDKLKSDNPNLTVEDLKLSAYIKIGMSNKEIANVTHLTLGSVKSKINRLKKKLEVGPDDSVRDYMLKYA